MIAQRMMRGVVEQTRALRRPCHANRLGIALRPAFGEAGERRSRAQGPWRPIHLRPDMRQRAEHAAAQETGDGPAQPFLLMLENEAAITRERLVGAVARQRDRHLFAREFADAIRSEEQTSDRQSLMRIS